MMVMIITSMVRIVARTVKIVNMGSPGGMRTVTRMVKIITKKGQDGHQELKDGQNSQ